MSPNEARSRIKTRAWQAIVHEKLDLANLPRPTLEKLVEVITDAALLEIDDEIGRSVQAARRPAAAPTPAPAVDDSLGGDDEAEKVLWEGRPFLSIGTQYIITSQRVRIVEGVLGKDREDIELVRVQDIDQSQTVGERMLGLGDVTIRSHDRSHPEIVLRNVKDPQEVHEILRKAVLRAREKYRFTFREEM
jgi:hypothetical protein